MLAVITLAICIVLFFGVHLIKDIWLRQSLPPGPRGYPFLGNFKNRPPARCKEWEHWIKFKDIYGPVSSITTMGQTIIILNDAASVEELLNKRSGLSSSRPRSVVTNDLTGWNRMVTLQGDANYVRTHRKYIAQLLGSVKAISQLSPQLSVESRRLLLRILERPSDLVKHIRRQSGATILKVVYGYHVDSDQIDPLVRIADLSADQFSEAAEPGKWLIDILPILKYLPCWFPGAAVKNKAREWKNVLSLLSEWPYAFVQHQMSQDKYVESYVSRHIALLGHHPSATEEFTIKWTAATMYAAGADTTVSAIRTFFLAMGLHQDVQRKAQQEIDEVVGRSRLPAAQDQDHLPYVNAVMKEVLRWHPVAPLGVAHATSQEDTYNGWHIPKDSILIPNIWAITHDSEIYRDPMMFNPSRFLDSRQRVAEPDPREFVFGFGRRICPGRYLAQATLFLTIAQAISVFDTTGPVDLGFNSSVEFESGIISHPMDHGVTAKPRDSQAEQLIREIETRDPWGSGDSQILKSIRKGQFGGC